MVRKKKSPQKKCVCPKPVLAVRTKQRRLPHRKRSQNLFGRFPKQVKRKRPAIFAEDLDKTRVTTLTTQWANAPALGAMTNLFHPIYL